MRKPCSPHKCFIKGRFFECRVAPFVGYKGENLFWALVKEFPQDTCKAKALSCCNSGINPLIGSSETMLNLQNMAIRIAKTDTTVLITGESGTGKDLIANLIQKESLRKNKPFLAINCNAINDVLLESELFGYEKGAFTGAHATKKGKFEVVDGGTIFLDEIGDISPRMQSVLLRLLQHGEIIRVGGTTPLKVDVRIIAATNRNLVQAVQDGNFRLDLFYRLSIINLKVPPLRERKEDLPELIQHFITKYCNAFGVNIAFNTDALLTKLKTYHWPGNIRELENVIQRAILTSSNNELRPDAIAFDTLIPAQPKKPLVEVIKNFNGKPLKTMVEEIEKEIIIYKLGLNGGNVGATAENLNICKAALHDKMKRFDISARTARIIFS